MSTPTDPTGLADRTDVELEREANELESRLTLLRFELKRRRDPQSLTLGDLKGIWAGMGDELTAAIAASRAQTAAKMEALFDDVRPGRPHADLAVAK